MRTKQSINFNMQHVHNIYLAICKQVYSTFLPLLNCSVVSSLKIFTVYKFLLWDSELFKSISLLLLYWIMVIVLHFLLDVSHLLYHFFALLFKPNFPPPTLLNQVCTARNNWNGRMQVWGGENLADCGRDGGHPCKCRILNI